MEWNTSVKLSDVNIYQTKTAMPCMSVLCNCALQPPWK